MTPIAFFGKLHPQSPITHQSLKNSGQDTMTDAQKPSAMDAVMADNNAVDFTLMLSTLRDDDDMGEKMDPYIKTLRGQINFTHHDLFGFVDGSFGIVERGELSTDTIKTVAVADPNDLLYYMETELDDEVRAEFETKIFLLDDNMVFRFDLEYDNPSAVYDHEEGGVQ